MTETMKKTIKQREEEIRLELKSIRAFKKDVAELSKQIELDMTRFEQFIKENPKYKEYLKS
jgi:hypothetical protein